MCDGVYIAALSQPLGRGVACLAAKPATEYYFAKQSQEVFAAQHLSDFAVFKKRVFVRPSDC